MATIKRGILGGFSGKVGNVIGSSWKGISVMKSMPLSVANPRTTAQVSNRTRFSKLTLLLTSILGSIVKPLNDRFAAGMSGINRLTKLNKNAIDIAIPEISTSFRISEGKMLAPAGLTISSSGGSLTIGWDTSLAQDAYASPTDEVYIVAWQGGNPDLTPLTLSGTIQRSAGQAVIPNAPAGVYRAFVAFRRADGTVTSDTGVVSGG